MAPIKRSVLFVLGAAQFLMVLDQSVMNVSISQLVEDFDTDVTKIQLAITAYSLVMAALMLTGGKVGDRWGRRRVFAVGLVVYAVGSALTAVSWSVAVLILGWSVIEGVGAAMVMPAMAALVGGNFEGRDRAAAYAVLGGIAGAGIAVGPILGGWLTANLTWRVVFAGEVVVAALILAFVRRIAESRPEGRPPHLDVVGAVLSAVGLGLVVLGILQASTWGWLAPKSSPVEPFGFSLTPFMIAAGGVVLGMFASWQRRRERKGLDPLVSLDLLKIPPMRSGLNLFLAQNLVLMGVFFVVPLYLQVVQGFDAFETGLRMLPVSVALFLTSAAGPALARRYGPRGVVRAGLGILLVGTLFLLSLVDPEIDTSAFSVGMAVIGIGMGALASQLGNVVQSSVGARGRSEAGGLQFTAQQLGSALGTALIGAIVISALAAGFSNKVAADERVSEEVKQQLGIALEGGISVVPVSTVQAGLDAAGVPAGEADAIVTSYAEAQLQALKAGLLIAAFVAVAAFWVTRDLPDTALVAQAGTAASRRRS